MRIALSIRYLQLSQDTKDEDKKDAGKLNFSLIVYARYHCIVRVWAQPTDMDNVE